MKTSPYDLKVEHLVSSLIFLDGCYLPAKRFEARVRPDWLNFSFARCAACRNEGIGTVYQTFRC